MDHTVERTEDLLPSVSVDGRLHGCKQGPGDVMHGPEGQQMMSPQYINLHRLQDNLPKVQLDGLHNDLLGHHVVELSSAGTIVSPNGGTNYYGEDLLGNELTEEDKRLAAALVAVQLVQQQKQNSILAAELLNGKNMTPLSPFTPSSVEKPGMAAMVTSYIQAFEEESAQHLLDPPPDHRIKSYSSSPVAVQQLPDLRLPPLPPLKKVLSTQNLLRNRSKKSRLVGDSAPRDCVEDHLKLPKMDEIDIGVEEHCFDDLDSDYEIDSDLKPSRRSLPHKKRIPKKLKSQPQRNLHSKCYKCQKCGDSFSDQTSFFDHRFQHSDPVKRADNFTCEICQFNSADQMTFFQHLKSHYEPKNESVMQTDLQHFNTEEVPVLMDSFSVKTIQKTQGILTCEHCGKIFKRQRAYETHRVTAHPPVEEFSEPEDMMEGIRHVVNIQADCPDDDTEEKHHMSSTTWTPDTVTHSSQTKSFLQSPDSFEESPPGDDGTKKKKKKVKNLECPHCPRVFVHRNSLLYHIRSHTGRRPHQCEVCGKSFFAANALRVHMRMHSGDKPFKCGTCGRAFRQWGDLKYHVTSLHSTQKQYQCEFCGKDFARKYSLIVHRRIHTNEKNYACEFCCKTFRASSYLVNHRRIHTGEKPHVCDICSKAFRVKSDLKRHRNTHNKERNSGVAVSSGGLVATPGQQRVVEPPPPSQQQQQGLLPPNPREPECILPDVTTSPLNLMRTDPSDTLSYGRETVQDQNTLYVWLPTGPDSILSDE